MSRAQDKPTPKIAKIFQKGSKWPKKLKKKSENRNILQNESYQSIQINKLKKKFSDPAQTPKIAKNAPPQKKKKKR